MAGAWIRPIVLRFQEHERAQVDGNQFFHYKRPIRLACERSKAAAARYYGRLHYPHLGQVRNRLPCSNNGSSGSGQANQGGQHALKASGERLTFLTSAQAARSAASVLGEFALGHNALGGRSSERARFEAPRRVARFTPSGQHLISLCENWPPLFAPPRAATCRRSRN